MAAAIEDELRTIDGHIRRMRDDAIERQIAGGLVQVAGRRRHVGNAVETAVELREMCRAPGDIERPGLAGTAFRSHQRRDGCARTQIQERVARLAGRQFQEQLRVGHNRRINEVLGRLPFHALFRPAAIGDDVESTGSGTT